MDKKELKVRNVLNLNIRADWSFTPRLPDYHSMTLIKKGKVAFRVQDEDFIVNQGEVILIPAGLQKSGRCKECGCGISIHFYGDFPEPLSSNRGNHIRHVPAEESGMAFQRLSEHWTSGTRGDIRCCAGYLQIILGLLSVSDITHDSMRVDPRVERMRQHLLTHLEEPTDLKSLARVAGVSRPYAGTLFRKQTGTTVQNYANALRVRKAQALLSDSSETLAEIAEQCGFDDVFYFSKVFKKHAYHSPSNFRRINIIRA